MELFLDFHLQTAYVGRVFLRIMRTGRSLLAFQLSDALEQNAGMSRESNFFLPACQDPFAPSDRRET